MADLKSLVDIFSTVLQILSLLGAGAFGFLARRRQQAGFRPPGSPKQKDWGSILLYIAALACFALTIGLFVKAQYFPSFVIVSPLDSQLIASDIREIEIRGIGAKPGEIVTVVVSDGHTQFRQTASGIPSQKGKWVVENVILQTPDYEYSIWAETQRNGTTILTENRVKAKRIDSSKWLMAFLHNHRISLVVIPMSAVGCLIFLRQQMKNQKKNSIH